MEKTTKRHISVRTIVKGSYNRQVIQQVVELHIEAFPGFFLTFLGKGFLSLLYKGFSMSEKSGLIVAEQGACVVGFLAYSEDLSGFYRYLIRTSLIPFAWYSLWAFFRAPSSFARLIRALLKPKESVRKEPYIELSSVGVRPDMKNQHIGSKLINNLKQQFDNQKFSYIKLETDAESNDPVNQFYLRNGFYLAGTYETPEGRKMNEYRWCKENEIVIRP